MIFKLEDVRNIANDKKAIQSSISQYSNIDDASRVLRTDIQVDDFAMHTGWEENPWWILDLEKEIFIDCIRITNRSNNTYQEALVNVKVELSLDKQTWISVDSSCFEWQNGLDILDVNIYQAMNTRYIKISLQGYGNLVLKKVEVFVRKIKGYVAESKFTAYGDRFLALLNALYLSEKLGLKFAFSWPIANHKSHKNDTQKVISIDCGKAEDFFDQKFLNQHYHSVNHIHDGKAYMLTKSLKELQNDPFEYPWGFVTTHQHLKHWIKDIDEDYRKKFPTIWRKLPFANYMKEIINSVEQSLKYVSFKEFVVLHIRSGDGVYWIDNWFYNFGFIFNAGLFEKVMPVEIAYELIDKVIETKHIVLSGEDIQELESLQEYFNKKVGYKKIYLIKEFYTQNIKNDKDKTLFDLNFMAKALKIYTSESNFSSLASLISTGKEPINFLKLFSEKERFEILIRNYKKINVHTLQNAFTNWNLYFLSFNLNLSLEKSCEFIQKVVDIEPDNMLACICLYENLLKLKNIDKAENLLQTLANDDRILKFIDIFLASIFYEKMHPIFILVAQENPNYPYISFIVAKISFHKQDLKSTKQYLQFCLEKEPNNKIFLEFYEQLNHKKDTLLFNKNLQENLKHSALTRVQNHLAYKLGQAMIENSKSLKGYIRMPYVLSYIKDKHKQEQNIYERLIKQNPSLKLPKLETYNDYELALKEKECFTYKLGEAIMRAYKTWYKGGFVKFYFEAKKLEKEFKKQKSQ